jgi:putative ABC transport system substrate-binding protein
MISRRTLVRTISAAVAGFTGLPAPRAQEAGRTYRIGGLFASRRDAPQHVALFDGLRRNGFLLGHNLNLYPRGYGLRPEQFADIAVEQVNANIDLIMCGGDPAIRAAQRASTTIPIVALTDDMVGSGLVRSLANPGGNTTGVSVLAPQLDGKRQEILMDVVPGLRRMAALADPNTSRPRELQALREAARSRGVELTVHQVVKPEDIVPAIDAAKSAGATALNVLATPLLFSNRRIIFERAAALRLPGVYQWPEMAEDGGLVAYGPRITEVFRELMARQVARVLRGAKPADVPVEQPTKFELVINLKTAKALGLTIPPSVLLRADRVIE